MAEPSDRIEFQGSLAGLCRRACDHYSLGAYRRHEVVETGYEDLNLRVETDRGTYLVKVFNSAREPETCRRYADLVAAAVAGGVTHPELVAAEDGHLHVETADGTTIRMVAMEFVQGRRIDRLDRRLSPDEFRALGCEAAAIHALDAEPPGTYGSWSIRNFVPELDRAREQLAPADRRAVERVESAFLDRSLDDLPHRLVHDDLRETNLILSAGGRLYVLDFAVAGRYPRLFEFAVLATTTARGTDATETERNLSHVLDGYDPNMPFTGRERAALPALVDAARAMEVVRQTALRAEGDESAETRRWLERGREAIRREPVQLPT